jgi:hypothetical protein
VDTPARGEWGGDGGMLELSRDKCRKSAQSASKRIE